MFNRSPIICSSILQNHLFRNSFIFHISHLEERRVCFVGWRNLLMLSHIPTIQTPRCSISLFLCDFCFIPSYSAFLVPRFFLTYCELQYFSHFVVTLVSAPPCWGCIRVSHKILDLFYFAVEKDITVFTHLVPETQGMPDVSQRFVRHECFPYFELLPYSAS